MKFAEDAWNSRDPERVALAYTEDSNWRNRDEFVHGREEIKAFLRRKWAKELDYRLKKELWGFRENRIAVSFEYEWHNPKGHWFRSYGVELWEFDENGLMRRRIASTSYELGYYPSSKSKEEGFRKIAIKAKQDGLKVRTKTEYFLR